MKILVACEFSGVVRRAFYERGHDVISCDLLPAEDGSPYHYQGPVEDCLRYMGSFDLMIGHPPCTHLCSSGARHFAAKRADGRQQQGIDFFMMLANANVPRIAIENPVGIMSTIYRKPDQIIQPYQFGHRESKSTCLWLKGLPLLVPTDIVEPTWKKNPDGTDYRDAGGSRYSEMHYNPAACAKARWDNQTPSGQNKLGPSKDRWKLRSITYGGIAKAMAEQWSPDIRGAREHIEEMNAKNMEGWYNESSFDH